MIYRWLTCFSLPLAMIAANVSGRVELVNQRGVKQKRADGVAVWLEPVQGRPALPPGKLHVITQKNKRFLPHVSVVPVGTTVDLPNFDPIFHNAFSNFAGQPFDTGLYPPGGTFKVRFQRDGVVRVFCNIHSTMSAVIVVVPSPWHTSSGAAGEFQIDGVPPGEYTVKFWHERATEATLRGLDRRVTAGDGPLQLPAVVINEAAFIPSPQANKYGRAYTPPPGTGNLYGRGKK